VQTGHKSVDGSLKREKPHPRSTVSMGAFVFGKLIT